METVKEKIAYLRGMIEGGDVVKDSTTKAIFQKLLEVLDDVSDEIDELYMAQEENEEYLEAVDADLAELEEDVYEADDDCCGHHHDDVEEDMVEIECPVCQEPVYIEEEFLYDDDVEVTCPDCGTTVYKGEEFDDEVFSEDEESE